MTDAASGADPVVLVTGVSRLRGIAAAVARRLGGSGWNVAMTGWPAYDEAFAWGGDANGPEQLLSEIRADGARAEYVVADLGSAAAVGQVFDQANRAFGPVSALVLVHTYDPGGGLFEITATQFDRHMAINPRATLLLTAEFARRYSGPRGAGRVVTFTSGLPLKGSIAYAASKGAIEWITVSAAAELAPMGITVNAVNPGPNDTGWMDEQVLARTAEQSPLGRVGRPADAADLVAFLCSGQSGWITGQVLTSDGGWSGLRA